MLNVKHHTAIDLLKYCWTCLPTGEARRNDCRRNYSHTVVKMDFEEESWSIKDEDTEEQIGQCPFSFLYQ